MPPLQRVVQEELDRPAENFCLCADAMYVNQDDVNKKSKQVLRMKDIYSKAYNILIWLGSGKCVYLDPIRFNVFLREAYKAIPTDSPFELMEPEPFYMEILKYGLMH